MTRRSALITGASSGIGAAFARRLAQEGYDLLLVARREDRLKSLAEDLSALFGIQAEVVVADLSVDADIERLVQRIEQTPQLAMLINNAGFSVVEDFSEIPLDYHLAQLKVHIEASVRLIYAALPVMKARGAGDIINVASIGAYLGMPRVANYTGTKAFLMNFSDGLALEVKKDNIRVQALCPGFTYTEIFESGGVTEKSLSRLPSFIWMSADEVVQQSLLGLKHGKRIVVPGYWNRVYNILQRIRPTGYVIQLISRGMRSG